MKSVFFVLVLLGLAVQAKATVASKFTYGCQQELEAINDKVNSMNSADYNDVYEVLSFATDLFSAVSDRHINALKDLEMYRNNELNSILSSFEICRLTITDRLDVIRGIFRRAPHPSLGAEASR